VIDKFKAILFRIAVLNTVKFDAIQLYCREWVSALMLSTRQKLMTKNCYWRLKDKSCIVQKCHCHSKCQSTQSRLHLVIWYANGAVGNCISTLLDV